jgi:hypothetical protein
LGQQECLEFLKEQSRLDPKKWFRVKDVQQGLAARKYGNGVLKGVAGDLLILTACGDIEMQGRGIWKHYKEFRFNRRL